MKNSTVARISPEEAPAIAAEIKDRMDQLGVTIVGLSDAMDWNRAAIDKILSGKITYKASTLQRLTDQLKGEDGWELKSYTQTTIPGISPVGALIQNRMNYLGSSPDKLAAVTDCSVGTIYYLLQGTVKTRAANITQILEALKGDDDWFNSEAVQGIIRSQEQQRDTVQAERKLWGKKLKNRREELGVSMGDLAEESGISRARVDQFEAGVLTPDTPALKPLLTALGYPREEIATLDSDTPHTPEWVARRKQRKIEERQEPHVPASDKDELAESVLLLRNAKGLSQEKLNAKLGIKTVSQRIEAKTNYPKEDFDHVLGHFGFKDPKEMATHLRDAGVEERDVAKLQELLDQLWLASRILRTHWKISGEKLAECAPEKFPVSENTIYALENPTCEYGKTEPTSLDTVIGIVTALHNADQKQPRKYQLLDSRRDLKHIVAMANKDEPLPTYGKHFRKLLENAINDIVDTAVGVEQGVYEAASKRSRVGLESIRQGEIRSLAEMFRKSRPTGNNRE